MGIPICSWPVKSTYIVMTSTLERGSVEDWVLNLWNSTLFPQRYFLNWIKETWIVSHTAEVTACGMWTNKPAEVWVYPSQQYDTETKNKGRKLCSWGALDDQCLCGAKGYRSKSSWLLLFSIREVDGSHGKVLGKRNFVGIDCGEKQRFCTRRKDPPIINVRITWYMQGWHLYTREIEFFPSSMTSFDMLFLAWALDFHRLLLKTLFQLSAGDSWGVTILTALR